MRALEHTNRRGIRWPPPPTCAPGMCGDRASVGMGELPATHRYRAMSSYRSQWSASAPRQPGPCVLPSPPKQPVPRRMRGDELSHPRLGARVRLLPTGHNTGRAPEHDRRGLEGRSGRKPGLASLSSGRPPPSSADTCRHSAPGSTGDSRRLRRIASSPRAGKPNGPQRRSWSRPYPLILKVQLGSTFSR
jgi:hypothetical protein